MKPDPWSAVLGLTVMVVVTGLVWLRSLDTGGLPIPVQANAEAPQAPAPSAPMAEVAAVTAVAAFAQRELPEASPAARASAASGLRLVAAAMAARGDSALWSDRALRLGEAADRVEHAADSTQAAGEAREALVQSAEWISRLPGPDSEWREKLVAAADSIRGDAPLTAQSDQLEHYFDTAARALGGASI